MFSKLFRFYVYSNLHISLSAAIFVSAAYFLIPSEINFQYVGFIFSGTFLIYNAHRLIGLRSIRKKWRSDRHIIFHKKGKLIYGFMILTFFIGISLVLVLQKDYWILLTGPVILSALYVLPVIWNKRLRDFDFIKIILIALVWSWLFFIPLNIFKTNYQELVFLEKFLFFLALTLPFDIRDRAIDKAHNLRTLGNIMAPQKTILLSFFLMGVTFLLSLILLLLHAYDIYQFLAVAVSYIFTTILLAKSINRKEIYFLAYLDGMIALHALLLILVSLV